MAGRGQMGERLVSWLEFREPLNLLCCRIYLCDIHRRRKKLGWEGVCDVQVHEAVYS